MGSGMAVNKLEVAHEIRVWNRSPGRTDDLRTRRSVPVVCGSWSGPRRRATKPPETSSSASYPITMQLLQAADHAGQIRTAVDGLAVEHVHQVSDRSFVMHPQGELEANPTVPSETHDDLSMACRWPAPPRWHGSVSTPLSTGCRRA